MSVTGPACGLARHCKKDGDGRVMVGSGDGGGEAGGGGGGGGGEGGRKGREGPGEPCGTDRGGTHAIQVKVVFHCGVARE